MTERTRSPGASAPEARATTTTETGIDPVEEKVVRMRHGFGVADDHPLPQEGQDNPDVAAQLREIELRALEQSGRLAELKAEAEAEAAAEEADPKQRIVDGLKQKMSK
jgi:hypothetical protein